jgi:hypothetical protein
MKSCVPSLPMEVLAHEPMAYASHIGEPFSVKL